MRIKAEDVVLTRTDKVKIFSDIVHNEILPWPVIGAWVFLSLGSHVLLLNNADWYHNLSSGIWTVIGRIAISIFAGFLSGVALICCFGPLIDKVEKHWNDYERPYREQAVKKVEELLLAQKDKDDY